MSGPGSGRGSRQVFGRTWWGRAWVTALEQRARLDPNRLPRGRTYARDGSVGELTFAPGQVRAQVQGRRRKPYEVRVRVRPFAEDEWARVLDAVSAQIGHAAALLDGDLPPEIAEDVAAADLDLMPGAGEVGPRCSCPDDADPCKHAAAVCYLVADALDADPFVALLLRGRTRDEVLAGLRSRRRTGSRPPAGDAVGAGCGAAGRDEGLDARAVYSSTVAAAASGKVAPATALTTPAVPVPPMPPRRPGHPATLPVDPPPARAGLREDLLSLAADAARRAWALAVGAEPDAGVALDSDADLARRAGHALGTPEFSRLAARAGADARELARWGLAWRHGGPAGFEVLRAAWDPGPGEAPVTAAACRALRDATGMAARRGRNRVTSGDLQLRLGRDHRWYPYARSDGDWEPAGPPQDDPGQAVASL